MKHRFKNYLKLGILLFGISIILFNCQKDDPSNTPQDDGLDITVKIIDFNELTSNKNAKEKLQRFSSNSKSSANYKDIFYNSEHGFSINTDHVKYVESGDYHSYNFVMIRDNPEDDKLENFFLSLNDDDEYDAYIIKYDFTQEEYDNKDYITGKGKAELTLLESFDSSSIFSRNSQNKAKLKTDATFECVFLYETTFETPCYEQNWNDCLTEVLVDWECSWTGNIGGTAPGAGSSDDGDDDPNDPDCDTCTGGGSGGGGTPPAGEEYPIISSPTTLSLEDTKNCDELKRLSTSAYLQDEFTDLKNSLNNQNEKGYALLANPNFPYFTSFLLPNVGSRYIEVPRHPLIYSVMHTHIVGSYEMFFHGDIHTLYKKSQVDFNASSIPSFEYDDSLFTIFMTVRNYTYAIKIDDPTKLANINAIYQNKGEFRKFNRMFEKSYLDINSDPTLASQGDLAIAFLKLIEQHDLGTSLFRTSNDDINHDPNAQRQTSNWQKVSINGSAIEYINCN